MSTITTTVSLNLTLEEDRFTTLRNWPVDYIDKRKVAKSGLSYIGNRPDDDRVQCFKCNQIIGNWTIGHIPNVKHRELSRNCSFMDLVEEDEDDPDAAYYQPRYQSYVGYSDRLSTFTDWPMSLPVKPEQLAEAGFFYLGTGDRTSCYFCGTILKHWMLGDDPWKEHAKWFDNCHFLRTYKGTDYIAMVKSEMDENTENVLGTSSNSAKPYEISQTISDNTIDDSQMCKICFSERCEIVFVPCGHVVACAKCGFSFNRCPTCRKLIKIVVRLYFS